jgi:signal transduction histidine kinase/CheY-like chemotaxis protein
VDRPAGDAPTDATRDERFEPLLSALERMAGGDLDARAPVSAKHDMVDALAHGLNVLVGELQYTATNLRRAMHEAEAANRAKTTFLRNLSHEIRTPLSAILGLAQLLQEPGLDEARRHEIQDRMLRNGQALLGLVEDLLDLSKVEAGRFEFELHPVPLVDLLTDVIHSLEPEARRNEVELSIESIPPLPATIVADPKRLRQILVNIVGNAIKFTRRGQVRARVAAAGDRTVTVDVIDTGIGIAPSQADALFAPFQQADPSIGRRFGGTGLGLALSKRLAEGMGGDVRLVESRPDHGTTFRIAMPVGAPGAVERPTSARPERGAIVASARVLVADDNEDTRATLADLLRLGGADVTEAKDGANAVELALARPFDVILMDIRMPVLDGLEATRRLRDAGCSAPIVALTADVVSEQVDECLAAGCNAFVPKPADYGRLLDAIARVRTARR